jgi:hypothetical protein
MVDRSHATRRGRGRSSFPGVFPGPGHPGDGRHPRWPPGSPLAGNESPESATAGVPEQLLRVKVKSGDTVEFTVEGGSYGVIL